VIYPFAYCPTRDGYFVGLFEGYAHIGAPPGNDYAWQIFGISLNAWDKKGNEDAVVLKDDDPLAKEIALWLYAQHEADINREWGLHVKNARLNKEPV
jgi:hypothetical protein